MRTIRRHFLSIAAAFGMVGSAQATFKQTTVIKGGGNQCYEWKLETVCETVYDIEYKEVEKVICKPVIKEIKVPVSCKVCKAVDRQELCDVPVTQFKQDFHNVDQIVKKQCVDECGNCHETCENKQALVSCVEKCETTMQVPVRKWDLVPVEAKHNQVYYKQEMKEEKIKIKVPVKVPRVIERKVWVKVPTCKPCETCQTEGTAVMMDAAPVMSIAPGQEIRLDPKPGN